MARCLARSVPVWHGKPAIEPGGLHVTSAGGVSAATSRHGHATMSKLHSTATSAVPTIPTWPRLCLTHDLLDVPWPAVGQLSAAKGSVAYT